ncbi:hypothetical protein DP923_10480 [Pontibacter arcticus]|uniref:Uncharacterized protein n=1 Tax=Pontibacter arcticus TaxID=2080288 RepID=A0A364RD47_9BACT|nr:hypothetical protein DP923_10480 [Pontibacter arcticus]
MRKLVRQGSGETVLAYHSGAMGQKKREVRFLNDQFAAQNRKFNQTLNKPLYFVLPQLLK